MYLLILLLFWGYFLVFYPRISRCLVLIEVQWNSLYFQSFYYVNLLLIGFLYLNVFQCGYSTFVSQHYIRTLNFAFHFYWFYFLLTSQYFVCVPRALLLFCNKLFYMLVLEFTVSGNGFQSSWSCLCFQFFYCVNWLFFAL